MPSVQEPLWPPSVGPFVFAEQATEARAIKPMAKRIETRIAISSGEMPSYHIPRPMHIRQRARPLMLRACVRAYVRTYA